MDTALSKRLNPELRKQLGQKLLAKYRALDGAMDKFRADREKFEAWAKGDYSGRETRNEQDIFSQSNIPMEFVTGVTDFMVARTNEDLFGSEPYFAAVPQGPSPRDGRLSGQLAKHFGYKLNEGKYKTIAKQANWRGYQIGEGLIKTTWRRVEDVSEQLAEVLCEGKEPVPTADGDFIFPEDYSLTYSLEGEEVVLWSKQPLEDLGERSFAVLPDHGVLPVLVDRDGMLSPSVQGEPWYEQDVWAMEALGVVVLSKSPVMVQERGWEFAEVLIEERKVLFNGLDFSLLTPKDVVVPLNVRDLGESDAVFHRLSLKLSTLRRDYEIDEETITTIGAESDDPKNADKQPQNKEGRAGIDPVNEDPEYEVIESYAYISALGDEKLQRIYALVEKRTETVIFCDYWANVVPECKVPIIPVVPCPVPGRWYGRGYQEIYEQQTEFLDRNFNAIIYRNKLHANPPGFLREGLLKDEAATKNFTIAAGKIHRLKNEAYDGNAVLSFVTIPDLDDNTWKMLELVMQMAQVRSGVTGAAQGAVTNLPANGTATGVQTIMLSGSTLHKNPIEGCKEGHEAVLALAAMVLYAHQDRDETFIYSEGEADELITLNWQSVKDLKLNVRLLMTRLHEREALESAKAAIAAVMEYINGVPEDEKDQLRPLFIQVLKALRITGADSILRRGLPPDPNAKPPQQERFTESMNYKDVPDDIKRQMERDAGYEPSQISPAGAVVAPPEEEKPINAE